MSGSPDSHANNMPIGDLAKGDMPTSKSHNTEAAMDASMGSANKADLKKGYSSEPMTPTYGGLYGFDYNMF